MKATVPGFLDNTTRCIDNFKFNIVGLRPAPYASDGVCPFATVPRGRYGLENEKSPKLRNKPQKRAESQPSDARCVGRVLSFVESNPKEVSFSPTVASSQYPWALGAKEKAPLVDTCHSENSLLGASGGLLAEGL